jgi:hypothetical protein
MKKTWTRWMAAAGLALGAAVMTACSGSSSGGDGGGGAPTAATDDAATAKAEFWSKFGGGDIQGAMAAQKDMIAAFPSHSTDDELARLIGFAYLIGVGAPGGMPSSGMPSAGMPMMPDPSILSNSVHYAQLAVDNASDPHEKMYDTGFLGGFGYSVASFSGDTASMAKYSKMIDDVIQAIPGFGYLTKADVLAGAPAGTPDYAASLESYFRYFEVCTGKTLDRKNPDADALLTRPFAIDDPACGNSEKVPHNEQGALMNLADAMVKGGNADGARAVYTAIKKTEAFSTWSFASGVASVLDGDVSSRVALYAATNPQPARTVGLGCFGCHQR